MSQNFKVDIGRTLLAARSMPHREMILFAELWTKQQPERGVLARIKDVPLDLSRTPVSAMYEDDLTELVYLIPRPTRNGAWDLIVGDTFDAGEGDCTEEYQQQVKNDRLIRARKLFAEVVPEVIPHLSRAVGEISVGYRPRGAAGAPILTALI